MPFQYFVVPVHDSGSATQELNSFLVSHKVLAVERQFVAAGPDSFWAICVDHWQVAGGAARPDGARRNVSTATRIDYKDRLSPADFKLFLKLREWRKQTAQAEAVPVYAIFTNEQLAQVVSSKAHSKADLATIDGIGEARVAKYAEALLVTLASLVGQTSDGKGDDETTGRPVEPIG